MELFGIIFAMPVLIVIAFSHYAIVRRLIEFPGILVFLKVVSILLVLSFVLEVLIFLSYGMTNSYLDFESLMKFLRLVNFIFFIPAVCNLIVMTKVNRIIFILVPTWFVLGISMILANITISEEMYGIDGNGGSIREAREASDSPKSTVEQDDKLNP